MTETTLVPSFTDEAKPPAGRKLAIICSKGNLDMAYPGLILGNAAVGEGIEVHLFLHLLGDGHDHHPALAQPQVQPLGNTAMHLPQAPTMPLPALMGAIPGVTKFATSMMRKQIADLDVPTVPEFLELMHESGVHLWACRMSFDMMQLNEADLYEGVEAVISASDFMEIAEGAQVIFI
ncbi:MAG: DsrE/DsrF/DrsH-like family protein [Micropruina sp.]|nr:DsrE/DsrF/DrsH-like family protein [Micropruina sp.]